MRRALTARNRLHEIHDHAYDGTFTDKAYREAPHPDSGDPDDDDRQMALFDRRYAAVEARTGILDALTAVLEALAVPYKFTQTPDEAAARLRQFQATRHIELSLPTDVPPIAIIDGPLSTREIASLAADDINILRTTAASIKNATEKKARAARRNHT